MPDVGEVHKLVHILPVQPAGPQLDGKWLVNAPIASGSPRPPQLQACCVLSQPGPRLPCHYINIVQ